MGWPLQKDSEFRECFNYNLEKMRERGIINNELVRIKTKYNEDFRHASTDVNIVSKVTGQRSPSTDSI